MHKYRTGDEVMFAIRATVVEGGEGSARIRFGNIEYKAEDSALTITRRSIHQNDGVKHEGRDATVSQALEDGVFLVRYKGETGASAYAVVPNGALRHADDADDADGAGGSAGAARIEQTAETASRTASAPAADAAPVAAIAPEARSAPVAAPEPAPTPASAPEIVEFEYQEQPGETGKATGDAIDRSASVAAAPDAVVADSAAAKTAEADGSASRTAAEEPLELDQPIDYGDDPHPTNAAAGGMQRGAPRRASVDLESLGTTQVVPGVTDPRSEMVLRDDMRLDTGKEA